MSRSTSERRSAPKAIRWAAAALLLVSGVALADNPHFIYANASMQSDGGLTGSFKIAGLDTNDTLTVMVSADVTAVYACLNYDWTFTPDSKQESITGPAWAFNEFSADVNGNITSSLALSPPESTILCPMWQSLVLVSVAYGDAIVDGDRAGVDSIPGRFERIFYDGPSR